MTSKDLEYSVTQIIIIIIIICLDNLRLSKLLHLFFCLKYSYNILSKPHLKPYFHACWWYRSACFEIQTHDICLFKSLHAEAIHLVLAIFCSTAE